MTIVAVDAGGSGSRVLVRGASGPHRRDFASINPASAGAAAAGRTLDEIVAFVAAAAQGHPVAGWWASAAVGRPVAAPAVDDLRRRLTAAGVRGTFRVSNDVLPLLFAPPVSGRGAVVVAGTGSAFWAADGSGDVRVAGGYEYLASDEGSASDLGLRGVRRAAAALDGRAGDTAMLAYLTARHGPDVTGFLRSLSTADEPKRALAGLAAMVTDCWLAGDPAATDLVLSAAGQLCRGLSTVRRAAGLAADPPTVLSGGLFTGCPRFADLVAVLVRGGCGRDVTVVSSPVDSIADAVQAARARTGPALPAGGGALVAQFTTGAEQGR